MLFIIFSTGQFFLFDQRSWAHYLYSVCIVIFGTGCVLAGAYPEDLQGAPETASGKIHGIASGTGFLFLIAAPLFSVHIDEFELYSLTKILFFIFGLLTFALFLYSGGKTRGYLKYTGLYQRLNLAVLYGALIVNLLNLNRTF